MAARSVDSVIIENFVNTGQTTPLPRYTFQLTVRWTDDAGVARVHGPQTYTYPNDLAAMPLTVRRAFAEKMVNATVRVALGIDDWGMYE